MDKYSMPTRWKRFLFTGLLLFSCATYCKNVSGAIENEGLVVNPSFENVLENGQPEAWTIKGDASISDEVYIKGEKSLQFVTTVQMKKLYHGGGWQHLKGLSSGRYTLSGYFGGDVHALWVVVQCRDIDSQETFAFRKWIGKYTPAKKEGWNKFEWEVAVPKNTVVGTLYVELYSKSDSSVCFLDDIQFKKSMALSSDTSHSRDKKKAKLVLSENFTSESIPKDWEVSSGTWEVKNGALQGKAQGTGAFIRYMKSLGGNIRLEYTAWTNKAPGDLSAVLSCDPQMKPNMNGYFFGFGASNNTKNVISKITATANQQLARSLMEGFNTGINAGVKHKLVVERKDGKLSFYRDGKLELTADDPLNHAVRGESFGFYTWRNASFSDVKVYKLPKSKVVEQDQLKIKTTTISDFQSENKGLTPSKMAVSSADNSKVKIVDVPTWVYTGEYKNEVSSKFVKDLCVEITSDNKKQEKPTVVVKKFKDLESGIIEFDLLAAKNSEIRLSLLSKSGKTLAVIIADEEGKIFAQTPEGKIPLRDTIEYRRRLSKTNFRLVPKIWHTIRINFNAVTGVIRDFAFLNMYTEVHGEYSRSKFDQGDYFSIGANVQFQSVENVGGIAISVNGTNKVFVDNICVFGPVGVSQVNDKPIILPARELLGLKYPLRKDPILLKYQSMRNLSKKSQWMLFMTSEDIKYSKGQGNPAFHENAKIYNQLLIRQAFVEEKVQMLERTATYLEENVLKTELESFVQSMKSEVHAVEMLMGEALSVYGKIYLDSKNAPALKSKFAPLLKDIAVKINYEEEKINESLALISSKYPNVKKRMPQACPQPLQKSPHTWNKNKKTWMYNGKSDQYFYSTARNYSETEKLLGLYPNTWIYAFSTKTSKPNEYLRARTIENQWDGINSEYKKSNKKIMLKVSTGFGIHYCMSTPPTWWLETHKNNPDIFFCKNDGTPFKKPYIIDWSQSYSLNFWNPEVQTMHKKWAKALGKSLKASSKIAEVAYIPLGAESVNFLQDGQETGHNKSAIKAFQNGLKTQFNSIEQLNQKWHATYTSFAEIIPPTERAEPNPLQYEFQKFRNIGYFDAFIKPTKKALLEGYGKDALVVSDFQNTFGANFDMVPYFDSVNMIFFHSYQNWDRAIYGRWLNSLSKATGTPWGTFESRSDNGLAEVFELDLIKKNGQKEQFYSMMWGARMLCFWEGSLPVTTFRYNIPFSNYILGNSILNYSATYAAISIDRAKRFGETALIAQTVTPDVAILEISDSYYNEYPQDSLRRTMKDIAVSLEAERMNYGFLYDQLIFDGRQKLDDLKTIIVPNALCVGADLDKKLAVWVKNGGVLISNVPVGLFNQYGQPKKGFISQAFTKPWKHINYTSWSIEGGSPTHQTPAAKIYEAQYGKGKVIILAAKSWNIIKTRAVDYVRTYAPQSVGCTSKDVLYCLREDQNSKYLYVLNYSLKRKVVDKVFVSGKYASVIDMGLQIPIKVPHYFKDGKTYFKIALNPSEGTLIKLSVQAKK